MFELGGILPAGAVSHHGLVHIFDLCRECRKALKRPKPGTDEMPGTVSAIHPEDGTERLTGLSLVPTF